jgi:protease PrsW
MVDGETSDEDVADAEHDATRSDRRVTVTGRDEPVGRATPQRDLQGIVTWEPCSRYDAICVALYRAYRLAVRAARAAILVVAVLVLASPLALTVVVGLEEPAAGAFVLVSALPAFAVVGAIWYAGDPVREPLGPLVVTFLLGTLAAGLATIVNGLADAALLLGPLVAVLVAPPVEECAKLAAVRLYAYRTPQFNAVIDGAVYGAFAGLGFAVAENAAYVFFDPELQFAAVVRAFAAPGHVLYTALSGYYLGLARYNPEYRGPILLKGLSIVILVHAAYNAAVSSIGLWALALDVIVLVVLVGKLRRYRSAYREVYEADPVPLAADSTPDGMRETTDEE